AYRGPCAAKSSGVPALRFAAAGKTGLKIKRTLRSALVPILVTQPLFQLFVRPLRREAAHLTTQMSR
ncbi:MAG: hypothetical protein ACK51R_09095, partial [Hyphomonadaceae bacterium]